VKILETVEDREL